MAETKAEIEAERDELRNQLEAALNREVESDERTIYQRILAIADEVGVVAAERTGGVPFAYRGVDQVVAALTPLLNKHGVFVVPVNAFQTLEQRTLNERQTLTKSDLTVTYRFYGPAGDYVEAQVPGQSDDFADRSTAQAMSVAFRILLLQTFHIAAFGNEEEQSQATLSARDQAATDKITKATAPAQALATATPSGAEAIRAKIVEVGGRKGLVGKELTDLGSAVTDKDKEQWWDNVADLNKILAAVNEH